MQAKRVKAKKPCRVCGCLERYAKHGGCPTCAVRMAREWRMSNREISRQNARDYAENNRERTRANVRRYRAKMKALREAETDLHQ